MILNNKLFTARIRCCPPSICLEAGAGLNKKYQWGSVLGAEGTFGFPEGAHLFCSDDNDNWAGSCPEIWFLFGSLIPTQGTKPMCLHFSEFWLGHGCQELRNSPGPTRNIRKWGASLPFSKQNFKKLDVGSGWREKSLRLLNSMNQLLQDIFENAGFFQGCQILYLVHFSSIFNDSVIA